MIGARLSPHRAHSTAVLVRVLAAFVTLGSVVIIPHAAFDALLGHITVIGAVLRIAVAAALTFATLAAVRRVDPLR